MIITISGTPGAGKNTVAEIIAKKLKLRHYSVGNFRRKKAKEMGLTILEYDRLGEKDPSIDKETDNWQTAIGKKEDDFVIDGRLSYHFIPQSIKILLKTTIKEGAKRIFKDRTRKEKYKTLEEAGKKIQERINSEKTCFKKYYNINPYEEKHYDLVIDTTNITAEQAAQKIIAFVKQ